MLPKILVVVSLCVMALSILPEAPDVSDDPVDEAAAPVPPPAPAVVEPPKQLALVPPPVFEHLERKLDVPAPARAQPPVRDTSPPAPARKAPPAEPVPAPADVPPEPSPSAPPPDGFAPVLTDVPVEARPYLPPTPEEFQLRFPMMAPPPALRAASCPCYVPPAFFGKPVLPGGPVRRTRLSTRHFQSMKETVAPWYGMDHAVARGARYEHLAFTGPGEVVLAFDLPTAPIVRAVLTARLSAEAPPLGEARYPSDVSLQVNGHNCGTQRVPRDDGAGSLRVWNLPPEVFSPGFTNYVSFRVCRNAVYAQGLSIYGRAVRREDVDATPVLELQYAASN
jgi:hypothetical protein